MGILTNKVLKTSCFTASALLLIIGIFHGSGINYVNELVQKSDVSKLVKDIFPVLFILPSLQLIGLGIIGIFAVKKSVNHPILGVLSILVLIDALFAFWLNAIIPGIILAIPALVYFTTALKAKKVA